ncbi:MAG: hypothetical protein CL946_08600 [Ectothiorhodospiraceae bacterium]|nr:hypothetical protein [Ectothiorhodospiraceae bacterium]
MEPITGILLAGGKSSRMGKQKALMPFNGAPMASYPVNILMQLCSPVFGIINDVNIVETLGIKAYPDIIQNVGPLGGLHAACTYSPTEQFVVLACDTPLLSATVVDRLLEARTGRCIVVPSIGKKLHPLIGVYSKSLVAEIESFLANGERSLRMFLHTQEPLIIDVSEGDEACSSQFTNINTQEEFEQASALVRK